MEQNERMARERDELKKRIKKKEEMNRKLREDFHLTSSNVICLNDHSNCGIKENVKHRHMLHI